MKTIIVIIDGLSEEKVNEFNMTPLKYAKTPTLDNIIKKGTHSKRKFHLKNREPDSLSCILSILGVHENKIPKNRAYLEALAAGIIIKDDEAVLRCNLISVKNNLLESFNGTGLTNKEMDEASNNVNTPGVKFHHLRDYRNIFVLKKTHALLSIKTMAPHEHLGENIYELLSECMNIEILNKFINNNQFIMNNMQYMFYPWGISETVILPSFYSLHNKTCSVVCSADIVKGIAKAMNIDMPILKNATGDVDTDLKEKARAVLQEILTHDVVIAHINGTDEVSHRKDLHGKIKFIEKIDNDFIKVIYENIKDTKLIILSDHQTSSITGKHEKGFVDYITYMNLDEGIK